MSVAEADNPVTGQIEDLLERVRPKANSLIVTVLGDAIMPRGGSIWLSDLMGLMSLFGLSDRLVRTGVYRLSQEGWLTSRSVGRRAQYSLSEAGFAQFMAAGKRIYSTALPRSTDTWTLVQGTPDISQTERQSLRRRLRWHGFGQISTTLMALPGPEPEGLSVDLKAEDLDKKVLIFRSELAGQNAQANMKAAAAAAWPLDELNRDYANFVDLFSGLDHGELSTHTPSAAFALRVLLIHEYRRILLKDPHLPADLLPEPWMGSEAFRLSASLYKQVAEKSDTFLNLHTAEDQTDPPALSEDYWYRFGGLR